MTSPQEETIPHLSSSIFHPQYPEIHWETLFIDSKFYIASPDSIEKLREIEGEIKKEKNRIGSLGKEITDAKKRKGSFLMKENEEEILEDLRVSRECATEVNFTKELQSKVKAEGELNEEEKKYTGRIHELKLRRSMKLKESRIVESNIENPSIIKSENFIQHKNHSVNQLKDQKSPKFNEQKEKSIKSDNFGSKYFSHISININKSHFEEKNAEKEAEKHLRMSSSQNKEQTTKSIKKGIDENLSDIINDDKKSTNKSVGKEMLQIEILNCKIQELTEKLLKIESFQEKYLTKVPENLDTPQLAQEYEFSLFERNKMETLNLSEKESEEENEAGENVESASSVLQKSNPLPKFSFEEEINNQESPIFNIGLFKKPKLTFASSIVEYSTESSKKKEEQKKEEESLEVQELKKMIRDLKVEKMRNLEVIKMLEKNNIEPNLESIEKQESLNSNFSLPEKEKVNIKSHNKINNKDEIKNNQSALSLKKRIRISKVYSNSLNKPRSIFNQEKIGKGLEETLNPLFYKSFNPEDTEKKHFQSFSLSQKGLVAREIDTTNEKLKEDQKYENKRSPKKHEVGNYEPSSPSESGKKMFELEFIKSTENKSQNNFTIDIPEIEVNSFQVPELPETPSPEVSQTELYETAKEVCAIFDIKLLSADNLHMKKYKNCIIFKIKGSNKTIVWHYNGKLFVGGWEQNENGEGKKNGEGFELEPKNYAYQGQFLDGKKNGSGIMVFDNGDVYDGQWLKGLRNGHGSFFQKETEAVYKGEWKDDKKEGKGILKVSQNEYYDGTFVKSIKQGYGKELFSNGDFYQGEYKSNQFHGNGKYFWANGSFYDGAFDSGKREGFGSWRSSKESPDIYNGQYKSDKKSGKGEYIWHNGIKYNGYFFNDLKHGEGHVEYQNGRKVKGFWENGKLVAVEQNIVEVGHGNLDLGSIEDGLVMNVNGL